MYAGVLALTADYVARQCSYIFGSGTESVRNLKVRVKVGVRVSDEVGVRTQNKV